MFVGYATGGTAFAANPINFENDGTKRWKPIVLAGAIRSLNNGPIVVNANGVSIVSYADIEASLGNVAIKATNSTITISGGSVISGSGNAIETTDDSPITINGDVTIRGHLNCNLSITPTGTLNVVNNSTLWVPNGKTLTNNGNIVNNGIFYNNGTIKVAKPTTTGTFTYDGNPQTLEITNVGISGISAYNIDGTTTATNAGDYTATAALNSGYVWLDDGTSDHSISWSIDKVPVTIIGVSASDKVYDGTVAATIAGTAVADGVIGEDVVTVVVAVTAGTAEFADKNVGTAKTVTFSGFSLSGADAGNYTLSAQPASVTANITPRSVTITGVTAVDRVYAAGNVTVELSGGALNGIVDGDQVSFDLGVGTMATADTGTGKSVTTNITLTGAAATNYTLTQPTGVTVTIGNATSVLSGNRTIPATPDVGGSVVMPSNLTSFEIAVGPNPVQISDGAVNIFAQGKSFTSAALTIYDATGNVVRKIDIRDNSVMSSPARRTVGVWDLRDARGRPVAEGTYLLRGVVKTIDGKRERVSVTVGVR